MALSFNKCHINFATPEEITLIPGITLEKAKDIHALIQKNGNLNKSGFLNLLPQSTTRTVLEGISFSRNKDLESEDDTDNEDEEQEMMEDMGEPRGHSTLLTPKSPKEKLHSALQEIRSENTGPKGVHFMDNNPVSTRKPSTDKDNIPVSSRRPNPDFKAKLRTLLEEENRPGTDLEAQLRGFLKEEHRPARDPWAMLHEEMKPAANPYPYPERLTTRKEFNRRPREEEYDEERRPQRKSKVDLKSLPRNLQFDGRGNWETFLNKFLSYASYEEWSEKDKTQALMWSLSDKASDFHAMLMSRDDDLTFKQQISRLTNRYGDKELTETSEARFYQTSQKVGEDLVDWSDRVQVLASKAFRGLPEEYLSSHAIVRFCQGLVDKRAGELVCTSRPRSIQEAIDAVRYHQHVHEAMGMEKTRSSIRYTYEGEEETARGAYAVQPERNRQAQTRDRPMRAPQQQEVAQASSLGNSTVENTLLKLQETMEKIMSTMTSDRRGRYQPGCFKCGKMDHIKRNCPDLTQAEKDKYLNWQRGGK